MAVGKEAPISNIVAAAEACRVSLEETVAEFVEILASVPVTTIKRRLKDIAIVMPNGIDQIECKVAEKPQDTLVVKKYL